MRAILFLLFLCPVFAQCQLLLVNGRFKIDNSAYDVTNTSFRGLPYVISVKEKSTAKVIEEYYRYDDSNFLYVRYNTTGLKIQVGFLKLSNEVADSFLIQMPDLEKDEDMSKGILKDTIVYQYKYVKYGLWKEVDKTDSTWKGNYVNGLREGEWEKGIYSYDSQVPEVQNEVWDYFRSVSTHFFRKGVEVQIQK